MSEAKLIESAGPDYLAVQLTKEEWEEQKRLELEFIRAMGDRDRTKAEEIFPKLITPSFLLKGIKKLRGADYIRKKGYNTIDADLAYGPDWLDKDDGGPLIKREIP